jgi:hypothetical protein
VVVVEQHYRDRSTGKAESAASILPPLARAPSGGSPGPAYFLPGGPRGRG